MARQVASAAIEDSCKVYFERTEKMVAETFVRLVIDRAEIFYNRIPSSANTFLQHRAPLLPLPLSNHCATPRQVDAAPGTRL